MTPEAFDALSGSRTDSDILFCIGEILASRGMLTLADCEKYGLDFPAYWGRSIDKGLARIDQIISEGHDPTRKSECKIWLETRYRDREYLVKSRDARVQPKNSMNKPFMDVVVRVARQA